MRSVRKFLTASRALRKNKNHSVYLLSQRSKLVSEVEHSKPTVKSRVHLIDLIINVARVLVPPTHTHPHNFSSQSVIRFDCDRCWCAENEKYLQIDQSTYGSTGLGLQIEPNKTKLIFWFVSAHRLDFGIQFRAT